MTSTSHAPTDPHRLDAGSSRVDDPVRPLRRPRRRAVILAWVVALLGTAVVGSSAFDVLSTDFGAGSSTESGRVAHQLDDLDGTGGQLAIVADRIDVADPQVQAGITADLARIAAVDGVVDVADPVDSAALPAPRCGHRRPRRPVRGHPRRQPHRGRRARGRPPGRGPGPASSKRPRSSSAATSWSARRSRPRPSPTCCAAKPSRCPSPSSSWCCCSAGLVAGGMPLLVALGGVIPTLAVLVARHPARRRVHLLRQRRQHARHRARHRLRAADGQPVPRGARPRPRRPRRRCRHASPPPAPPSCSPRSPSPSPCPACSSSACRCSPPSASPASPSSCCAVTAAVTLLPATLAVVGRRIKPPAADARRRGPLLPARPPGAAPPGRRRPSLSPPSWCCSVPRS